LWNLVIKFSPILQASVIFVCNRIFYKEGAPGFWDQLWCPRYVIRTPLGRRVLLGYLVGGKMSQQVGCPLAMSPPQEPQRTIVWLANDRRWPAAIVLAGASVHEVSKIVVEHAWQDTLKDVMPGCRSHQQDGVGRAESNTGARFFAPLWCSWYLTPWGPGPGLNWNYKSNPEPACYSPGRSRIVKLCVYME